MRRPQLRFTVSLIGSALVAVVVLGPLGSVGTLAATRYEDLSLFTTVLNLVRKNYVEPVDEHRLIRGALRGLLQELDPHSSYLDRDVYKEMQIETKGEFAGLGIEISKREDGYVEVVAPIDGTPAARAGIRARDQIVEICPTDPPADWNEECRSTKNLSLVEAVHLMRGKKGTEITIRIAREGSDRAHSFTIKRDIVKVVSVSVEMIEPGYAYVRLRAFQERTARDLDGELAALGDPAELKGLLLDLRDNPGGLLDQAVKVADVWLDDGLIVRTKGRTGSQRQQYFARRSGDEGEYPIVVLVNGGSASASEIVAGALQDQKRALVLGTPTFGKGSVQTIIPLEDGSGLRLTTALYFTPADRSIQEVGIVPDILVEVDPDATPRAERRRNRRLRESDLEGHFTQEDAHPEADDAPDEAAGEPRVDDLQLSRALEVLKSWRYFEHLNSDRKAIVQRDAG